MLVPYTFRHGRTVHEAGSLVAANRAALQRTAEAASSFCSRPAVFEEILTELCERGTLRRPSFEGGRMLWSPGPRTT